MVKTDLKNANSRKSKLLNILNNIKNIVDSNTTQKDIKLLYEDISINEPELLNNISMFCRCLLNSTNDIMYNYNIKQLKRLIKNIESNLTNT